MSDPLSADDRRRPTEHDYIGLSEASAKPVAAPHEAEGPLEETELRLELGLGLGLGLTAGGAKREGEGESKESQASRQGLQLELGHASRVCSLESSFSKNWMKRAFSETMAVMPAAKGMDSDAMLRKESSFAPAWASSHGTAPSWHPAGVEATLKSSLYAPLDNARTSAADGAPSAKDRVVGWPPVRSSRRQTLAKPAELFVKVNMDGVTVGRKVDLNAYNSYGSLQRALEEMFQPSTSGIQAGSGREQDAKHFLLANDPEFVLTYEDKEGDWMLVGDVPWSLFVSTIRRLRITRGVEATGSGSRMSDKTRMHVR